MDRRRFISLIAGSLAAVALPINFAFADDTGVPANQNNSDSNKISISESYALEMGVSFFQGICPDKNITAKDAIPIFSPDGTARSFIVHVSSNNEDFGYVIFDDESPLGIAEFAYGEDAAKSPWQMTQTTMTGRSASRQGMLYKIDTLTYCSVVPNSDKATTNYGEKIDISEYGISTPTESSRSLPGEWDDDGVFLDAADVYRNYIITSANAVSGYVMYDDGYLINITGKYACAVTAMLTVCSYYYNTGGLSNAKSDFEYLWNASGTSGDGGSGGYGFEQGSTPRQNNGPAVKSFLARYGVIVNYNYVDGASWSLYKNCIDSGNMAIFGAALAGNRNSGHAMAVSGYITISDADDITNSMNTITVFDGWAVGNRILNFNPSNFYRHEGTFFSS